MLDSKYHRTIQTMQFLHMYGHYSTTVHNPFFNFHIPSIKFKLEYDYNLWYTI